MCKVDAFFRVYWVDAYLPWSLVSPQRYRWVWQQELHLDGIALLRQIMAVQVYLMIVKGTKLDHLVTRLTIIGWLAPFPLAVLPLFADMYGNAGPICYIKNLSNSTLGDQWRFGILYAPALVVATIVTGIYLAILIHVRKVEGATLGVTGQRERKLQKAIEGLFW
jgi:hypothetical protein